MTTPGKGILLKKHGNLKLEYYTDANYTGALIDRRSTSSYCALLGGNLVIWGSKNKMLCQDHVQKQNFNQ